MKGLFRRVANQTPYWGPSLRLKAATASLVHRVPRSCIFAQASRRAQQRGIRVSCGRSAAVELYLTWKFAGVFAFVCCFRVLMHRAAPECKSTQATRKNARHWDTFYALAIVEHTSSLAVLSACLAGLSAYRLALQYRKPFLGHQNVLMRCIFAESCSRVLETIDCPTAFVVWPVGAGACFLFVSKSSE